MLIFVLAVLVAGLFLLELITGTVHIPFYKVFIILTGGHSEDPAAEVIVLESRLPRALTAILGGSALAVSGLLMQTLFRNPLAGPSVLGISTGSSLGVALMVLATGGVFSSAVFSGAGIAAAAVAGAMIVLLILLLVARRLPDNNSLLIFGIMLGYFTSAAVSILEQKAANEQLRAFILWGMGSFAETDYYELIVLFFILVAAMLLIRPIFRALDLLLLGDDYALSMGVPVRSARILMILSAGLLAGGVTAFAGPVAFIGLAVPHIARTITHSSSHRVIFIPVILIGGITGLMCDYIARTAGIPLNAVASAFGAPVILYFIIKGSKSKALF